MTDEEIRKAVWSFDDGTPLGAARAGHHAVLFHQYQAALQWYDLALKRGGPRGPVQVSRGLVQQHLHDIGAARAALDEAVRLLPDDRIVAQHRLVLGGVQ
jgi:tetratricopeptide (TPR) repeat protein